MDETKKIREIHISVFFFQYHQHIIMNTSYISMKIYRKIKRKFPMELSEFLQPLFQHRTLPINIK